MCSPHLNTWPNKREKLNERPSEIHAAPSLQGYIQNHFESSPNTKIPRRNSSLLSETLALLHKSFKGRLYSLEQQ
jgi:hypothetical protein